MMHTTLFLVAVSVLTTAAIRFPMVRPASCDYCSEYEVLHTTPPCCEATCYVDCSRVVCPKMLVYQPTCVCLDGFVRHDGHCIPKTSCPSPKPPPCETTTPAPQCETTTATTLPCEGTTKPSVATTTTPYPTTTPTPCPTTTPVAPSCYSSPLPYSSVKPLPMYTPKLCGYTPPPLTTPVYVPPPPPPNYQTIAPYRYSPRPRPSRPSYGTMKPVRYMTTSKPCPTSTTPCPTTTTTTTVCPTTTTTPTTTTPCPTTSTPCPTLPAKCAACEQLVLAQPCCEPSCDYDCSDAACPLVLVEELTCACRPGLVRYQGHCIEPSACPRSASRYRLYVPVEAQCLHCNTEVLTVV